MVIDWNFTLNHTCVIFEKQSVQTWVDMSHNNEFNNEFILITFQFHLLNKPFYYWLTRLKPFKRCEQVVFQCKVLRCSFNNSSPAFSTATGCFHSFWWYWRQSPVQELYRDMTYPCVHRNLKGWKCTETYGEIVRILYTINIYVYYEMAASTRR